MSSTESLDIPEGNHLGPLEFEITPEMVRRWAEVTDDRKLLSSKGEVFLPPALLFGLSLLLRQDIVEARSTHGDDAVQSTYDLQTHRPILLGEKLTAEGKLVRRYIKRQREYFVWDIRFRDEAGQEVAHYLQENLETYKKVVQE